MLYSEYYKVMKPSEFVEKWEKVNLKEISAAQSHFNDICALIGHPTPVAMDPKGKFFTFEEPTEKIGGKSGRADVWYKDKFIWEYKGFHKNLDKAYEQLLLYRESLGNPPLLVTSDMHRIIIHTNFNNTVKHKEIIELTEIKDSAKLEILRRVFFDQESLRPSVTQEQVTKETASTFVKVAETLQKWSGENKYKPEQLAQFIIRLLFSLFAEDMELLPDNLFTKIVEYGESGISDFKERLGRLFSVMSKGGNYGKYRIYDFDGNLFDDEFLPDLPWDVSVALKRACDQDWSNIDPSILGTLFERIIDQSKRAQLGAHYTSKEDITLLVEPVLMNPLRDEWLEIKDKVDGLLLKGNNKLAVKLITEFSDKLSCTFSGD